MTAKDKAIELVKKHINYLCISDETAEFKAKESALITVKELIYYIHTKGSGYYTLPVELRSDIDYWAEVKNEITKLQK